MTKFKVFWFLNLVFIFTTIPFYIYYQRHFSKKTNAATAPQTS